MTKQSLFIILPIVIVLTAITLYSIFGATPSRFPLTEKGPHSTTTTHSPHLSTVSRAQSNTTNHAHNTPHANMTIYSHTNPNPKVVDLSHYFINTKKQIGRGGFSRVFVGKRITLPNTNTLINANPIQHVLENDDYDVAVKVIHKARYFRESQDPKSKPISGRDEKYLTNTVWSERNAWTAFSSPPVQSILPLNHIIQDDHALYYISPLVLGSDMDMVLNKFGPLSEPTVRRYAAAIVSAFEGMHARGYVYKDIKLKNLLLDEHGDIHVIDFGLSRATKQTPVIDCVTDGIPGRAGTKSYKAPEVLEGKGHSYPADFYSLGVVLYKMLTGHKLYHSDTDSPTLRYQVKIPKYHIYKFKQNRWKSFPVYPTLSKYQQKVSAMVNDEKAGPFDLEALQHLDMLDHNNQKLLTTSLLNNYLNKLSDFNSNARDDSEIDVATRYEDLKQEQEQQKNDKADQNDASHHKKSSQDKNNAHTKVFAPEDLFNDGIGPIFTPTEPTAPPHTENQNLPRHDGVVATPFAWSSLTDDAVDFLNQLVTLNPFYRLGTHNRLLNDNTKQQNVKDNNQDDKNNAKNDNSNKLTQEPHQDETSSSTSSSTPTDWSPDDPALPSLDFHDFTHTQAALLDHRAPFHYKYHVTAFAHERLATLPPEEFKAHCFPQYLNTSQPIPSFKGRDAQGKWRGLHSGFVEIKNHPWFKDFDWDTMQDADPKSKLQHIAQEEKYVAKQFDIKNLAQRWPQMIPPHEDVWDVEKYWKLFEGLDFNTEIGKEIEGFF